MRYAGGGILGNEFSFKVLLRQLGAAGGSLSYGAAAIGELLFLIRLSENGSFFAWFSGE